MATFCAKCGSEIPTNQQSCGTCGAPVAAVGATYTPVQPPLTNQCLRNQPPINPWPRSRLHTSRPLRHRLLILRQLRPPSPAAAPSRLS